MLRCNNKLNAKAKGKIDKGVRDARYLGEWLGGIRLSPRERHYALVDQPDHAQSSAAVAAGTGLMKMWSPEEMQELRNELAGTSISQDRVDLLIHFLDSVALSFIDQRFKKSSVQLSLTERANYAFNGAESRANLPKSEVSELVDLRSEGAINTKGRKRQLAP